MRRRLALALTVFGLTASTEVIAESEPDRERAPHPEPRVIVSVHAVNGPHAKKDVERAARLGWGRIVRCYKASPKRPRGALAMELVIGGGGAVVSARRTKSTLGDPELAGCLTKAMRGLVMPKARKRSIARVEIQLAPGDSAS